MDADVNDMLAEAARRQRAGDLSGAEGLYQEALRAAPDQFDALHLLGAIAHQRGDAPRAIELISRAITANATSPAPIFHWRRLNRRQAPSARRWRCTPIMPPPTTG
jgi:tetratricopeptide (TPR) repeat protein